MSDGTETWERLCEALIASDARISRSTMMGLPCLRFDGAFFGSLDTRSGELVVKLPADEVSARVAAGQGRPFAPAGKVFREWIAIGPADEAAWRTALDDALGSAQSA